MSEPLMHLKIMLPFRVFLDANDVARIVAETASGFFGILPRRLDCVAALVPGLFIYSTRDGTEHAVALDEGVLVKAGRDVSVAARNAVTGADPGALRQRVEREFCALDEREKAVRTVLAKLESNFIRRLTRLRHA